MEEDQITQQPPTQNPIRVETPIPISDNSGAGIIPVQFGGDPTGTPLPRLTEMLPEIDGFLDQDTSLMEQYPYHIPAVPNTRSMDYIRGVNQSFLETGVATGAMGITQFFGGLASGAGYLIDAPQTLYNKWNGIQDDYSNVISKWVEDNFPQPSDYIFEKAPGTTSLGDAAFWGSVTADVAHSAGLMAPAVALAALSQGAINAFAGSSPILATIGNGIVAGAVQRMGESAAEAHEISRRVYKDAIDLGYSEEQAKALMSKAGSTTYNENMKLALLDMLQMQAIFGAGKNLAGLRGNAFTRFFKKKYVNYPFQIGSEAAEEGYQYGISEKAYEDNFRGTYIPEKSIIGKTLSSLGDPDAQRAMLAGAMGGGLFTALGPRLSKLTQSKEYKEFLKQNEQSLKKLATPDEINKVKDDYFLDLITRHANARSLDRVQDYLDKMSSLPEDKLKEDGLDPEAFYKELELRKIQTKDIGKIYNDIYGRTKVDPVIKHRLFKNYALKYYLAGEIKKTREELELILNEEIDNGNRDIDVDSHIESLLRDGVEKLDPRNEFRKKIIEDLKNEFAVPTRPDYKRTPIVKDVELADKADKLISLIFENKLKDAEIIELNKPNVQKELIKQFEESEKVKEVVKAEEKKVAKAEEKKTKAADTQKEAQEKGKETKKAVYNKDAINQRLEKVAQKLIDNNGSLKALSDQERADYEGAREKVHKKIEEIKKRVVSEEAPQEPEVGEEADSIEEEITSYVDLSGLSDPQKKVRSLFYDAQSKVEKRPTNKGKYYEIGGEKYERVSSLIDKLLAKTKVRDEDSVSVALTVGSNIDTLARDFFKGTLKKRYKGISKEAYEELVNYLGEFKAEYVTADKSFIITDNIVLYDEVNKIAGEVDLLLIDVEGNVDILDFKTSKNFAKNFERYSREKYTYQLSSYSNLMENQFGIKARALAIIPIEVGYREDGYIQEAEGLEIIDLEYDTTANDIVPLQGQAEEAEEPGTEGMEAFGQSELVNLMDFRDFSEFLKSKTMNQIIDRLEEKKVIKKDCD
jgi:hypothetical protein